LTCNAADGKFTKPSILGRRSRILGLILFNPFQQTLQNKADFSEMFSHDGCIIRHLGGEFNGKKAVSPPSRPNSSFGMTGKMKIQTFYEAH
jgi:hypothetical protein